MRCLVLKDLSLANTCLTDWAAANLAHTLGELLHFHILLGSRYGTGILFFCQTLVGTVCGIPIFLFTSLRLRCKCAESNGTIEKLNLESNNVTPATLAKLFEALNVQVPVGTYLWTEYGTYLLTFSTSMYRYLPRDC